MIAAWWALDAYGMAVVMDVVYNHLGPSGNYLGEFGPYFTDKYETPWGMAVNLELRQRQPRAGATWVRIASITCAL